MQEDIKEVIMTRKGYDHKQDYYHMMKNKEFTDVTLVTDDKKETSAHKLILSAASPILKNKIKDEESIRINAESDILLLIRNLSVLLLDSVKWSIMRPQPRKFYRSVT